MKGFRNGEETRKYSLGFTVWLSGMEHGKEHEAIFMDVAYDSNQDYVGPTDWVPWLFRICDLGSEWLGFVGFGARV